MKYFKEVKLWKIMLLNLVIGALMTVPAFFAAIAFSGLNFGSLDQHRHSEDTITGIVIILFIIAVIIISNLVLWAFSKSTIK